MINNFKKYFDYKLISILSIVSIMYIVIHSLKTVYMSIHYKSEIDWNEYTNEITFALFLIIIFMIFITFTTKYLIKLRTKLIYIIAIHLFFSLFIGIFVLGTGWLVKNYNSPIEKLKKSFETLLTEYVYYLDSHFLLYLSLVTIIYIYYYLQRIQEIQIKTANLQEQLTKSRLTFLQSQMHPHFLFNTLNGIHSLIDIDINKSKNMIVDLSDILRNVIDKKDQNLIELQDELVLLKKYIHINKTRFSDQLQFYIDFEDGLEYVLVPNMLIQPIVENATKHGYDKDHNLLDIYITIFKNQNDLHLKIENNGKKLEDECQHLYKKGTGLSNIKERLNTLYNGDYELRIYNSNDRVITELRLPIKLSISEITEEY